MPAFWFYTLPAVPQGIKGLFLSLSDKAMVYGVSSKALNQAVKRNARKFPPDFMFRLTKKEKTELFTNCDRFKTLKHSTVSPCAFTEQGVAMLSSVLSAMSYALCADAPSSVA